MSNAAPAPVKTRRHVPPLALRLFVCACIVAIVWVRQPDTPDAWLTNPITYLFGAPDEAISNIATLILGFIAAMSLLIWFSAFSGFSRALRLGLPIVLGTAIIAWFAKYRIERFSGAMLPSFTDRWAPEKDTTLGALAIKSTSDAVDLATTTPYDYPEFLGPGRANRVAGIALETHWEKHPPKCLWRQRIGAGWGAFSMVGPFAVTLEQRGEEELVTCYEVETGKLRWAHSENARHSNPLGGVGPRSTPTIDRGRVYALGATGILLCLEGATGEVVWRHDLLKEFGDQTQAEAEALVQWGRAGSPLVVDDKIVVPAGGAEGQRASLVAYDRNDGHLIWKGGTRQVSYSSPSLATISGKRQILIVNEDTVAGHDPESGDELWVHNWPGTSNGSASASQAVPVGDDRLFLSKGYSIGCLLLHVSDASGKWQVDEVWPTNPRAMRTKMSNVAFKDGYVYGLSDTILECVEVATGASRWKGGRYGYGQVLLVGDVLLIQCEDPGDVALVAARPDGFRELSRIQALEGQTWNNSALSEQRLLIRNAEEAACYELPLAEASVKAAHAP